MWTRIIYWKPYQATGLGTHIELFEVSLELCLEELELSIDTMIKRTQLVLLRAREYDHSKTDDKLP